MPDIPSVPQQNNGQSQIFLPRVTNPYLGVWWTTQTVSDVPENVMGWLVAQGFEVTGITQDDTTTPPTNYFNLTREGLQPQQVLLSLCNSYTLAANEARTANQVRYNQIVGNWSAMLDSSHVQFEAQIDEQNAQAGVYLTDLDEYMDAIDALIEENRSQIVIDANVAKSALNTLDGRLTDLETNAQDSAITINGILSEQETYLQTFLNDYTAKLAELDADYASHLASILSEVSQLENVLDSHVTDYSQQFTTLSTNYVTHQATLEALVGRVSANVTDYTSSVASILTQLEADYADVEVDLNTIKTSAGTLVDAHAATYDDILDLLESDYNTHAGLARGFLTGLGDTELARINEEFAAKLTSQLQELVSKGLYVSDIPTAVTARNARNRDEQIQALNDRLMREKLENQHTLYGQQAAMRGRTLDGKDRLHAVQQEVLRYQASLVSSVFSLLQEARNRILAGKAAIFTAKDSVERLKIDVESGLYAKLQDVRQKTIDSLDRIYQLRDVFAKWESGQTSQLYEQLLQVESQHVAAIGQQHGAKQEVSRNETSQRDRLLQQLQEALSGLISGKERYASVYMQASSTLADHKHRAIGERLNTAVQKLQGWKSISDENRALLAYQLDERNKLLIGLYSFVERRDDIAPEWKDMATMIASLGDSGGGWITP